MNTNDTVLSSLLSAEARFHGYMGSRTMREAAYLEVQPEAEIERLEGPTDPFQWIEASNEAAPDWETAHCVEDYVFAEVSEPSALKILESTHLQFNKVIGVRIMRALTLDELRVIVTFILDSDEAVNKKGLFGGNTDTLGVFHNLIVARRRMIEYQLKVVANQPETPRARLIRLGRIKPVYRAVVVTLSREEVAAKALGEIDKAAVRNIPAFVLAFGTSANQSTVTH